MSLKSGVLGKMGTNPSLMLSLYKFILKKHLEYCLPYVKYPKLPGFTVIIMPFFQLSPFFKAIMDFVFPGDATYVVFHLEISYHLMYKI